MMPVHFMAMRSVITLIPDGSANINQNVQAVLEFLDFDVTVVLADGSRDHYFWFLE